jgi:hypothetical protein
MAINNKFSRKYSEWIEQWKDKNVQDLNSTYDFVSSESTLLVSGPPEYTTPAAAGQAVGADIPDDALIPVGLVQNASIAQNKQIQQLNEVGSRQMFTIPGRTYAQANIARILFDGPSLLFAISTYYNSENTDELYIPNVAKGSAGDPTKEYPANTNDINGYTVINQETAEIGAFWGNLGSSVFNKPLGLGFIFLDTESEFYGGIYLEKCYIASYNIGISAQQTILLENVAIRATRVRPVKLSGAV